MLVFCHRKCDCLIILHLEYLSQILLDFASYYLANLVQCQIISRPAVEAVIKITRQLICIFFFILYA